MNNRLGLVLLTLTACSGPGSLFGEVDDRGYGEINSAAFGFVNSTGRSGGSAGGVSSLQAAVILLSSAKDACADATAQTLRHGEAYLALAVIKPLVFIGSYGVIDPSGLSVQSLGDRAAGGLGFGALLAYDDACQDRLAGGRGAAVSGTITLNGINGRAGRDAFGYYTLALGPRRQPITGSFEAPYCAGLSNLLQGYAVLAAGAIAAAGAEGDAAAGTGGDLSGLTLRSLVRCR